MEARTNFTGLPAHLRMAISALRMVAHDRAAHSQMPALIAKEETAEWKAADALQGMLRILSVWLPQASNFEDVNLFHEKMKWPKPAAPSFLDTRTAEFRSLFLQEEKDEFDKAVKEADMQGAADALVDLVVVAMGTARLMGIHWDAAWNEVQRANISKVPGVTKRGHYMDATKPKGWQAPDHTAAVGAGPWPLFCTVCCSSGFEQSPTGKGCTFCDGTEGGAT